MTRPRLLTKRYSPAMSVPILGRLITAARRAAREITAARRAAREITAARRAARKVGLLGLFSLSAVLGCGNPVRVVQLQLMCDPSVSMPNAVSFVFKAQVAYTNKPVTDLLTTSAQVLDNAPNYENIQFFLQHPAQLSLRTLILLDASGSLWTPDGSLEKQIKTAALQFVDQIYKADQRNMIGVYMFRGADDPNLLEVYPFSAARDQALSAATYANLPPTQQEQALTTAWTNDQQMLEQAVMTKYVTARYATTGLFDATLRALALIQQPSTLPAMTPSSLSARTLLVFTDGNDEVYTGQGMAALRSTRETEVLQKASAFRTAGDNTILVAGLTGGPQAPGDQLDLTFLNQLATPGGLLSEDLSKLPEVFGGVAQQAVAGVQKYYQFNMCSPRRKTPVEAQLRVAYPDGTTAALMFKYDATNFHDPTEQQPCDVMQLKSCDITN